MSATQSCDIYKKGINGDLDKKLSAYRKLRIWAGDAWRFALPEDEMEELLKL